MNRMIKTFTKSLLILFLIATSPRLAANAEQAVNYSAIPAVDCVINPFRVVDISSPVAGVIEKLHVDRSQPVSKGQVIARLEASVERANVDLARYRASVESEIELGMVNINFDRLRKQRVDRLLEESNVSRENADQVEREVQLSEWKLTQARELAEIRKLELRKAQAQLRQKSISSPFDGFVLDIFKHRGEYVEDQAIARLAQLDPLVIEAIVPMENFGRIQTGMQADVVPEILLKDKLRGEVIAVDRIGDTASNTFGVKLRVPNPENRIPAGLKCIAKFIDTPPEQIAAAAENPARIDSTDPRLAQISPTRDAIEQPESLLSAVIGNAHAATSPLQMDADSRRPLDEDATRSAGEAGAHGAIKDAEPSDRVPSSYMVVIKMPESQAATKDLVRQLRSAGENDFLVYSQTRRISLGVYETLDGAVERRNEVEKLGFKTHTLERYR